MSFLVEYQEIVARARTYIRSNLERPFTIPELAFEIGLSNRYLLKIFRKVLNQSVVDFIRSERINKAKTLLRQTQISTTAVAIESGFEDYAHFAKTFRRKVGTTPSHFRKKAQSDDRKCFICLGFSCTSGMKTIIPESF